jgi:hypothetical protein
MHVLKVEQIAWHWQCLLPYFFETLYTETINEAMMFEEENSCEHLHLLHLQ